MWSHWKDSNPQHDPYRGPALPLELQWHKKSVGAQVWTGISGTVRASHRIKQGPPGHRLGGVSSKSSSRLASIILLASLDNWH